MITSNPVITAIAALVFGLSLTLAGLRLRSREQVIFHLILYMGLGLLLSLSLLIASLKLTPIAGYIYDLTTEFTQLAMTLTFGALTLNFLKKERKSLLGYWGVSLAVLLLWVVFTANAFGWGQAVVVFLAGLGLGIHEIRELSKILSELGWIVAISTALTALTLNFRKRQPTQYLNRLRYWLIATTLVVASGLILFVNPSIYNWAGLPLLVAGSVLVSYTVLSHHTPDLKLLVGRTLRHLGVTSFLFIAFLFSLAATVFVTRNVTYATNVLLWSIALALLLANIFPLLWGLSDRLVTRIVFGKHRYDQKQVIKHYSRSISSALDMHRLGDIIINLMIETLGIERGVVFVNERSGSGNVSLRPLASVGITDLTTIHFSTDSPFIDHFRQEDKVLSQYDVDTLPEFRPMPDEEKKWLAALSMELYVAILRQRELIGLLAFGPRPQGIAYYEEDFDLMISLADQAALAIDSARLFEQLAVINQEVGALTGRLAGVDQDKSDFLAIASHELRTPLTHIHGYSRMLLDLTQDELQDPNYVKTIIEGIVRGSDRMKDVVDLMFDVTTANEGQMNLFLGPVDLQGVIDQAIRPFLPALDERRIAFSKKGFKDFPTIEADGTRLMQAFENLIGNAIKYTPDGGIITVEGRSTFVEDIGSAVEIVVADTGIGIDPKYHERIFEKFFREDDTMHHSTGKTKFKGAGPGLGLTLVKAIAEAHGGRVWVESPGHDEENCPGSQFFLVIPLQPIKTKKAPQSQIETRHWRRKDLKATGQ